LGVAFGAGYLLAGHWMIRRLFEAYGPVVAIPSASAPVVLVKDPRLVKQVFAEKPDILLGGRGVRPSAIIYGTDSMFIKDEPEHLRRRKLLTPPLHGKALESYQPVIDKSTRSAVAGWPSNEPFRMLHAARRLTLDVILRVVFGPRTRCESVDLGRPFQTLLDIGVSEQLNLYFALRALTGLRRWPKLDSVNRRIDELVMPMIALRRRDVDLHDYTDIMSLMLSARTDDGEYLTDREIRDDLVTLVLAGYETTATTFAWMIDFLLHYPAALDQVQTEADSGESTVFTEAVINETLRLRPPSPFTGRYVADNYQLGDYLLPRGARILLNIAEVNINPESYEFPQEFRPERFNGHHPLPYAWIPFGGGVKRCLGASLSIALLTRALHIVLTATNLEPVHHRQDRQVLRGPVLFPHRGVLVSSSPRSAR
jgi:cytochrome P450